MRQKCASPSVDWFFPIMSCDIFVYYDDVFNKEINKQTLQININEILMSYSWVFNKKAKWKKNGVEFFERIPVKERINDRLVKSDQVVGLVDNYIYSTKKKNADV